MQYHSKELSTQETARYLRSVKMLAKGKDKKVARAIEDLRSRVDDPDDVMLRRLWWGRETWERFLGALRQVSDSAPVFEILASYEDAWARLQMDWDRWNDHFRTLRHDLEIWVAEAGRKPIPLDLGARKPLKEIGRADKEFDAQSPEADERLVMRMRLAVDLDPTVRYDVTWGEDFENPDDRAAVTWPWSGQWPHDFDGMGEWLAGERLLATVVRLLDGRGSILTGQVMRGIVNPGALLQQQQTTHLVVCDSAFLVLQRMGLEYTPGQWNHVGSYPYRLVEIGRKRGKDLVEVMHPESSKPIFWAMREGLHPSVFEAITERVAGAGAGV